MQLRQRLESRPETLSDFSIASEQKYWEVLELAVAGRTGAGIYLLGYSAEMILKIAAFRFIGANPADAVEPYLAPARQWMNRHAIVVAYEGVSQPVVLDAISACKTFGRGKVTG